MGCLCKELAGDELTLASRCIGDLWIFRELAPADLRQLVQDAFRRKFSRNRKIFLQGDPADEIMLIKAGRVRLVKVFEDGTEVTLDIRSAGDFIDRWFQFRHQEGDLLWGKLAVAIGVGGSNGRFPADEIEKFLGYSFVETVAKVSGQGTACCYSCGYGENCRVGIPYMLHGEGVKITPDMIPDVARQPDVMQQAAEAGKLLGDRLSAGHDRRQVTQKMQQQLMARMKNAV